MQYVTAHTTWCFHGKNILKGTFFKLAISLILKSNKSLLVAFFKSLDRFMVLLFVSITLELSRANLDVNDQLIVLWLNLAKKA